MGARSLSFRLSSMTTMPDLEIPIFQSLCLSKHSYYYNRCLCIHSTCLRRTDSRTKTFPSCGKHDCGPSVSALAGVGYELSTWITSRPS